MSETCLDQALRGAPITACEVVDCHGHVGPIGAFHAPWTDADGMVVTMDRLGIRRIAISSTVAFYGGDVAPGNDLTAAAVRAHPDRFIGYCAVNGNYPGEVHRELLRGIDRIGLTHVKLHPGTDGTAIDSAGYADVWPIADERELVVLIHTWAKSPAAPAACGRIAERFPRLRLLLGHAGGLEGTDEAARVAREVPNVFLDTVLSSRRIGRIEHLVEHAGVEKVLYGSDLPFLDAAPALGPVVQSRLSEAQKRAVLGENARRLFRLDQTKVPGCTDSAI
jgi:predicted TIM-barrel fold metal-dependent hydrolase